MILERIEGIPEKRFRAAVFAVALVMRLLCLAWWEKGDYTEIFGYDPYVTCAQSWLGWAPPITDVGQSPGFALWAALVFFVVRRPAFIAVQLCNVLFGCAACLVLGRWAEQVASKTVGRLSALWCAFDPLLVFFSVQLQSEPFFIFLELVFFLALFRLRKRPFSAAPAIGLGVLGGFLSLTRSVFALYPIYLLTGVLLLERRRMRAWMWMLILVGWSIPISIWSARNYAKYQEFIPLAVNGGFNLWEGFTLDQETVRRRPVAMSDELHSRGVDASKSVKATSRYFFGKWKRFVAENPGESAKIIAGKALLYWRPWPYNPYPPPVRVVLAGYFIVLFALALFGAWSLKKRYAELVPVYALFLYLSMLHSVFFTSLRYRSPLEPFLCFFAAAGFAAGAKKISESGLGGLMPLFRSRRRSRTRRD